MNLSLLHSTWKFIYIELQGDFILDKIGVEMDVFSSSRDRDHFLILIKLLIKQRMREL